MLCGSDFSATLRFFSSFLQRRHNSGENAQRRTHFHMLPAHRSPGTATGKIFYPSVVPDPLRPSKIHAAGVMTIPPREVL